ncbi:hypothetical protein [Roseivirga echinicomitans]|uniref:Uncharacterized protein n=1 Tax=Roseivirga echinicomitans TaxID=296218 RepID=A0A150XLA1_9BACT|nr:hypothetical protein [Roseivirga echinicomitans]KYG79519.1 hypothetical protein AWN68_17780 [Roseivirga echinicomitans]
MRSQLLKNGWLFLLICCMHIAGFNVPINLLGVESLNFFNYDDITSHDVIFWDTQDSMSSIRNRIKAPSSVLEAIPEYLKFREEQFQSFFRRKGLLIVPLSDYLLDNDEPLKRFLDNIGFNFLRILGVENSNFKLNRLKGTKVKAIKSEPFVELLKNYPDCFKYTHVLKHNIGDPILKTLNDDFIVGTQIDVGEGAVLFIPPFNSQNEIFKTHGREALLSCIDRFNKERLAQINFVEPSLPSWVSEIQIGNESTLSDSLSNKQTKLNALHDSINSIEIELNNLIFYKRLICSDGVNLERAVKKALEFIGFKTLHVSTNRADLLFEIGNDRVVFEIKGVSGSAGEKHASQLEKWVNEEHDDDLGLPKGILLVNTFKNLPISERTEPSFPNQMLNFSEKRDHCLMTGHDLLQMLSLFMKGEMTKEEIAELLTSTVGILKIN